MRTVRYVALLLAVVVLVNFDNVSAVTQEEETEEFQNQSARDATNQSRHFRMSHATELEPGESARIYDLIKGALAKGYATSGFVDADRYQSFPRYNDTPYVSSTHGNHYLNNYANAIAKNYGKFEQGIPLPVGSIIYKDSFAVTESRQNFSKSSSRQIILGPLFVMRKMEKGFNSVTGDWQYIQIQPDGETLGMTGGEGAERVEYCIGCHLAREDLAHLYFVPKERRQPQ